MEPYFILLATFMFIFILATILYNIKSRKFSESTNLHNFSSNSKKLNSLNNKTLNVIEKFNRIKDNRNFNKNHKTKSSKSKIQNQSDKISCSNITSSNIVDNDINYTIDSGIDLKSKWISVSKSKKVTMHNPSFDRTTNENKSPFENDKKMIIKEKGTLIKKNKPNQEKKLHLVSLNIQSNVKDSNNISPENSIKIVNSEYKASTNSKSNMADNNTIIPIINPAKKNDSDSAPNEYDILKQKLNIVELENAHLKNSLENEKNVVKSVLKRIESYSRELTGYKKESSKLISERDYVVESLNNMTRENNIKLLEYNYINDKLQTLQCKVEELNNENYSLIKENSIIKDNLKQRSEESNETHSLNQKNIELKDTNSKLSQNILELKNEYSYLSKMLEDYKTKMSKNDNLLHEKQREISSLEDQINQINYTNEKTHESFKNLQDNMAKLYLEREQMIKTNESNVDQVDWLNSQIESLKRNYTCLSNEQKFLIDDLQNKNVILDNENKSLQTQVKEYMINVDELNQNMRLLKEDIDIKNQLNIENINKLQDNESMILQLKSLKETLQAEHCLLQNKLKEKSQRLIQEENSTNQNNTFLSMEQEKFKRMTEEQANKITELTTNFNNVKDLNTKFVQKIAALNEQISQKSNRIVQLQEELDKINKNPSTSQQLLQQIELISLEKQCAIDELSLKNHDLENKLNQLNNDQNLVIIDSKNTNYYSDELIKKLQYVHEELNKLDVSINQTSKNNGFNHEDSNDLSQLIDSMMDSINNIKQEKVAIQDLIKEIALLSSRSCDFEDYSKFVIEPSTQNGNRTFLLDITNTLNRLRYMLEKVYSSKKQLVEQVNNTFQISYNDFNLKNPENFSEKIDSIRLETLKMIENSLDLINPIT